MSQEDWVLRVRTTEDARSLASHALIFRSLDLLVGAGAWVDISAPTSSSLMHGARHQILQSARRHRTSRTGRVAVAALTGGEWEERTGRVDAPEPDMEFVGQKGRVRSPLSDAWGVSTDASSVDWLRREMAEVAPDAYEALTGWAQVGSITKQSPTVLEVLLSGGSAWTAARFGPRFVIAVMRTVVDGWDDIREERRQHDGRMRVIDARTQTVLATEQARQEAARLIAEACRQGRRALQGSAVDPESVELAERIAGPALSDLLSAQDIDEVTLARRARS